MTAHQAIGPGSHLGPYRIEERLGEGAVGIVFRATRGSDPAVALKVLREELSHDEEFRRRFVHEARAAREVRHKHLVPIVDTGEADGRSYLAARFIPGPSLERRLEDEGAGAMALPDVARLVAHVGSALDALHAAGIVHRDVKPSNVLIDEGDSALLTDFGLAKGRAYTVLTKPGSIMGTLDYLSPELLRGGEATPATDLYALGCLAYECVAGRTPFGDRPMMELANAHLNDRPPDPAADRTDAPSSVSWAILQVLAKEPDQRPPTGTAFGHLLAHAIGDSSSN